MKKIIQKIAQAVQVVLMAPIKLPVKALNVLKYIAVALGIIEQVMQDDSVPSDAEEAPKAIGKEEGAEGTD